MFYLMRRELGKTLQSHFRPSTTPRSKSLTDAFNMLASPTEKRLRSDVNSVRDMCNLFVVIHILLVKPGHRGFDALKKTVYKRNFTTRNRLKIFIQNTSKTRASHVLVDEYTAID